MFSSRGKMCPVEWTNEGTIERTNGVSMENFLHVYPWNSTRYTTWTNILHSAGSQRFLVHTAFHLSPERRYKSGRPAHRRGRAPLWRMDKFSAVRRLSQRLLDSSKNLIFNYPICICRPRWGYLVGIS